MKILFKIVFWIAVFWYIYPEAMNQLLHGFGDIICGTFNIVFDGVSNKLSDYIRQFLVDVVKTAVKG